MKQFQLEFAAEQPATSAPEALTLTEFNERVKGVIASAPDLQGQWVVGETSDVNDRRGHCYLELIEKHPDTGATVARLGAVMWASTYRVLADRFLKATGSQFTTGIKVMVKVNVSFHEQFGLKAVITDIQPEFTLGDAMRRRKEILDRLTREGIIDLNRQRPWPVVAQRIAVVSAPAAAGFGDFMDQLSRNAYGLKFYVRLYDAMMQGEKTASTILEALESINQQADLFDCVVIIRGGGSTSDLAAFDDYNLAAAIAQFPLPVIVGVGHERDITVLDYVAALRVKTPTAAAETLILRGANALAHLDELRNAVATNVRDIVAQARQQLAYFTSLIPGAARAILDRHLLRLRHLAQSVPQIIGACLATERQRLTHTASTVRQSATQQLLTAKLRLDGLGDKATLLSPRNTLNRGYALVKFGGRFITDASQLKPGDVMTVHFKQGMARAVVQSSQSAKK